MPEPNAVVDPNAAPGVTPAVAVGIPDQNATPAPSADATLKGKFQAHFSPELQSHPELLKHGKLDDLGKAYLEQGEKLKRAVILPGEGASKEEIAAFHKALGVPENGDYKLETNMELPPGLEYKPEGIADFKKAMFEMGVPEKVAQSLWKRYVAEKAADLINSIKQLEDMKAATDAAIRKEPEWAGEEAYARGKAAADNAVHIADPSGQGKAYLDATGLGNDLMLIKMFANLGKHFGDDVSIPAGKTGVAGGVRMSEAGNPIPAEIDALFKKT